MWSGQASARHSQAAVCASLCTGARARQPRVLARPQHVLSKRPSQLHIFISTRGNPTLDAASTQGCKCEREAVAPSSSRAEPPSRSVTEITKAWVNRFIIGQNVCPFAAAAMPRTNFVVSTHFD
eukprot:5508829-Pyramimonas_sp.AAC.1